MPEPVNGIEHFLLPDLGEGLTEAEVVTWRVAAGEEVALNQVLVEVETEKAVVELPSPHAGIVVALFAGVGETIAVGAPLVALDTGTRGEGGEAPVPMLGGYGPAEAPASRRRTRRGHRTRGRAPGAANGSRPLAPPPVRFMARQQGVDLAKVTGRGPGGIVTREDLAAHLEGAAAGQASPAEGTRESRASVRGVQKHMAEAMVRSVASAPQATVFLTLDVTPATKLLRRLGASRSFEGVRVTILTLAAGAVVLSLPDYPALNSQWDSAEGEVVTRHYVNLGIAVAGPRGLVVPNVKDAHRMGLRELAGALGDVTARARAARCTLDDFRGGTITITNIGIFGVDTGTPLLNPGEAAILALGTVQRRPWELDGAVALRDVVTLSLSFDHRLVDGQAASRFLAAVGQVLADPTGLVGLG